MRDTARADFTSRIPRTRGGTSAIQIAKAASSAYTISPITMCYLALSERILSDSSGVIPEKILRSLDSGQSQVPYPESLLSSAIPLGRMLGHAGSERRANTLIGSERLGP